MARAALLAFVALAAGCGILPKGRFPQHQPQEPTFSQFHQDGWEWGNVARVLVLPILNESPHTRAGDELRAALTSELQRLGRWEVIAAAPDDRAVLAAQIHRNGRFDEAAMLLLAQGTGADVIVHGIITQYSPAGYGRPRLGLILQAVSPEDAKVIASVDGLWDTTDAFVAERCRIFYRQSVRPRPAFLRNTRIPIAEDSYADELALESPALFQRWVCHEATRALLGLPIPGVITAGANSSSAARLGAVRGGQSACAP